MQIEIRVNEEHLLELDNFLRSNVKYEHTIQYTQYYDEDLPYSNVKVQLFFHDYIVLEEWKLLKKEEELTN